MKSPIERFWPKVKKEVNTTVARGKTLSPCWTWVANKDKRTGHGKFWDGEKQATAYGFAYKHFKGEYDKSLELDHICENPPCVNPDHLEPVTRKVHVNRSEKIKVVAKENFKRSPRSGKPPGTPYKVAPKGGLPTCVRRGWKTNDFTVQIGYKKKRYFIHKIQTIEEAVKIRDSILLDIDKWIKEREIVGIINKEYSKSNDL